MGSQDDRKGLRARALRACESSRDACDVAIAAREALGGADGAPTINDTLREENAFLREQLDGARCAEEEARREVQELQDERTDMLDEMETMNDELQGAVSGPRPRTVLSS